MGSSVSSSYSLPPPLAFGTRVDRMLTSKRTGGNGLGNMDLPKRFSQLLFDPASTALLGRGKFGQVTREKLVKTNQWVIVKRIAKSKQEGWSEGEKELYLLSHIRPKCSPYFLCVAHHQEDEDYDYLWFPFEDEFVTWATVIQEGISFFPTHEICGRALQNLIRGLIQMHAMGMAHRDIKPANILVRRSDGAIRYIDFGSSCLRRCDSTSLECQQMIVIGTPLYSPPEFQWGSLNDQMRKTFDDYVKADYWGLGLLMLDIMYPPGGAFKTWQKWTNQSESLETLHDFQKQVLTRMWTPTIEAQFSTLFGPTLVGPKSLLMFDPSQRHLLTL